MATLPRQAPKEDSLAELIIDSLDLGIVVYAVSDRRVLLANHAAREALAALEASADHLPESIASAAADALGPAFSTAVPLSTSDGRRYFLRTRFLRPGVALATLTLGRVRESDLVRLLGERFGTSPREARVVYFACQGLVNKEIAERTNLSEASVRKYLNGAYQALHVGSRGELLRTVDRILAGG